MVQQNGCWKEVIELVNTQVALFLDKQDSRPVTPSEIPVYETALSDNGALLPQVAHEFNQSIEPWLSSSNGPRYLGFVTGGAHESAIIGDWFASLYDQNVVTKNDSIASSVESSVASLLLQLFDLPNTYHGTFVTGATMANFVGLACARQWVGEHYDSDVSAVGIGTIDFKIFAGAAHSSIFKALAMLGIGRNKLEQLPLIEGTEKCDLLALERKLEQNLDIPVIFCASAGTVNLVCFDDLFRLSELKKKYPNLWVHTDAAFGMFASLVDKHHSTIDGIDCSDSITVDCHKWLNTPYDAAITFIKKKRYQVSVFKNVAPYLNDPNVDTADFIHLAPENSRRFRALPVWFILKHLGRLGIKSMIESCCLNAEYFCEQLSFLPSIAVMNKAPVNIICFYVKGPKSQVRTKALMAALNKSGITFMTPTALQGTLSIRAAFSNYKTTQEDVDMIIETIVKSLDME